MNEAWRPIDGMSSSRNCKQQPVHADGISGEYTSSSSSQAGTNTTNGLANHRGFFIFCPLVSFLLLQWLTPSGFQRGQTKSVCCGLRMKWMLMKIGVFVRNLKFHFTPAPVGGFWGDLDFLWSLVRLQMAFWSCRGESFVLMLPYSYLFSCLCCVFLTVCFFGLCSTPPPQGWSPEEARSRFLGVKLQEVRLGEFTACKLENLALKKFGNLQK